MSTQTDLATPSAVPDDCRPSHDAQLKPFKEEPYTFLSPNDEEVDACWRVKRLTRHRTIADVPSSAFFGLDHRFPRGNLLVRNASGQPQRSIYLTAPLVRLILEHNAWQRIRLISCGVKLFARQDNRAHADETLPCKWRVVSDGTAFFRPFIGPPRLFRCSLATLKHLMHTSELNPRFDSLEEDGFRTAMQTAPLGSCIVDVQPGECDGAVLSRVLPVGVWISRASVNLMLEKRDKAALALRLWGREHV